MTAHDRRNSFKMISRLKPLLCLRALDHSCPTWLCQHVPCGHPSVVVACPGSFHTFGGVLCSEWLVSLVSVGYGLPQEIPLWTLEGRADCQVESWVIPGILLGRVWVDDYWEVLVFHVYFFLKKAKRRRVLQTDRARRERVAAQGKGTCHVPPSPLAQRLSSAPSLVPRCAADLPRSVTHLCQRCSNVMSG
jgi:hypothetical protein